MRALTVVLHVKIIIDFFEESKSALFKDIWV